MGIVSVFIYDGGITKSTHSFKLLSHTLTLHVFWKHWDTLVFARNTQSTLRKMTTQCLRELETQKSLAELWYWLTEASTILRLLPIPECFTCLLTTAKMEEKVATSDGSSTSITLISLELLPEDALQAAIQACMPCRPSFVTQIAR